MSIPDDVPNAYFLDREYTILASCMHAGSRVVRLSHQKGEWDLEVLAKFELHKSMNYGSDVQPLLPKAGGERMETKRTIVSTSFYDKLMCVWEV
jgi:diphthamide biosynthesis protein 7